MLDISRKFRRKCWLVIFSFFTYSACFRECNCHWLPPPYGSESWCKKLIDIPKKMLTCLNNIYQRTPRDSTHRLRALLVHCFKERPATARRNRRISSIKVRYVNRMPRYCYRPQNKCFIRCRSDPLVNLHTHPLHQLRILCVGVVLSESARKREGKCPCSSLWRVSLRLDFRGWGLSVCFTDGF